MFVLSTLFILVKHTVTYLWLREGLWVGIARKVCWLACCKIRLDIFRHPAASGMLHFTYFLLDISSGTLNRMVVCVMEYRVCVGNTRIIKSLGMSLDILAGFVGSLQPELQSLLTGVLSSVCTSVRLQVCLKL